MATIDLMVAAAKIRTLALIRIAHQPKVVPGTRAASDSTRALVEDEQGRRRTVVERNARLGLSGLLRVHRNRHEEQPDQRSGRAGRRNEELVVLLRDHRVNVKARGAASLLGVDLCDRYRPRSRHTRSIAALSEQDATIVGRVETMPEGHVMDVQFIASIAVIAPDPSVSRRLYLDALGLPLMGSEDDYLHSEDIEGSKSFGVWPLTQAAQACFGTLEWPADRPVPQASIEFEVADAEAVQVGADELKEKGFTLLHEAHTEPWGQTVARLQSSEGVIIGLSYVPSMHS